MSPWFQTLNSVHLEVFFAQEWLPEEWRLCYFRLVQTKFSDEEEAPSFWPLQVVHKLYITTKIALFSMWPAQKQLPGKKAPSNCIDRGVACDGWPSHTGASYEISRSFTQMNTREKYLDSFTQMNTREKSILSRVVNNYCRMTVIGQQIDGEFSFAANS